MRRALRWLSRGTYAAGLEGGAPSPFVEGFLAGLWRDAPWYVALAHTLAALLLAVLPPFILGRLALYPSLSQAARDDLMARLLASRVYPLRLLAYAVRGNALVAALRDPTVRAAVLAPGSDERATPRLPVTEPDALAGDAPVPVAGSDERATPRLPVTEPDALAGDAAVPAAGSDGRATPRLPVTEAGARHAESAAQESGAATADAAGASAASAPGVSSTRAVGAPAARAGGGAADDEADFVVVGSGAAGATVALALAEAGRDVLVVEEGGWHRRPDFTLDVYGAMRAMFRDFGAQVARGPSVFPVMEGRCVGGSTVMNGGIVHRLPREVHAAWCEADPALAAALPWAALEGHAAAIERELGVRRNLEAQLGGLPVAAALAGLGLRAQAMARNAPGCQATGRCLQGCPSGGKLSMEASFVPRAQRAGARVVPHCRVVRVLFDGERASRVAVVDAVRGERLLRARRAVILAAGAVRTPLLLAHSGVEGEHVGRHFQCHLGAGTVGLLPRSVRDVEGPPQGIEVMAFEDEGLKLATQLLPPELLLARTPVVGGELIDLLRRSDRLSAWTASVRAEAEGRVSPGAFGRARIDFSPGEHDVERLRRGIHLMTRILFALGATRVFPGVVGAPRELRTPGEADLVLQAPLDPRGYVMGVGHVFGTCRMASDAGRGVVAPDFHVHGRRALYAVDASVFPSNIGVNPQLAIMTLSRHAANALLAA